MASEPTADTADPEGPTAFQPYVPASESPPEFTWSAVLVGTVLGLVFAASSLYLVLKVGMTVSASIPVTVLAITLFRLGARLLGQRPATILENNVTQTAGSAGESIAFGVGVTMPALLLLGFGIDLWRVMVVSILGGILGILAMIPLRRLFIVRMHGRPGQPGTLLYPEGTACAQVLMSGERGGTSGQTVFLGFGLAFLHKFATEGMGLLKTTLELPFSFINKSASLATEMASELLGVGYIIGLRISAIMMGGAVLGYLVIIPLIAYFGSTSIIPPGDIPIKEMNISQIRNNYLLYIGAGCVATAGIISMLRTLPVIIRSARSSFSGLGGKADGDRAVLRTENDMPMQVVIFGSLGLLAVLTLFLIAEVGVVAAIFGALLVVLFGFLFVTVSARLTGEIGSSSNPISGMTVATLMVTCLIFLALGWTGTTERVLALSIAAIVCIASSNGGTTAQSLKTGFLVGGTPKYMQYAILIGALASALVIGGTLIAFNQVGTVVTQSPKHVPDFTLTQEELKKLPGREVWNDKSWVVWDTHAEELTREEPAEDDTRGQSLAKFKKGRFLVDPESGKVTALVDPAIMGKVDQRDDGSAVNRSFDAPKTQVMGIIINGVLKQKLDWGLVAIGGLIAVTLELCGVSALAFAVGVYVPIQYSVPIFIGGLVRAGVDAFQARRNRASAEGAIQSAIARAGTDPQARAIAERDARAAAEVTAIRESETSSGVLLASGYIAGGSLAGVLIAFLAFNEDLPKNLATWQYRTTEIGQVSTLDAAAERLARHELNLEKDELTPGQAARVKTYKDEVLSLNEDVPVLYAPVPAETTLKLPQGKEVTVETATTLGEVARSSLGRTDNAGKIQQLNKNINPAQVLPGDARLKVPPSNLPAFGFFVLLVAVLAAVGMGWLLRSKNDA